MSSFQSTISTLGITASFYDWYNQYNTSVLTKLNLAQIARPLAGDGITFTSSSNGGYTFDLSGTVSKNMVFNGDVTINGLASFANTQLSGLAIGVSGNFISAGVTAGKVVRVTDTGGLTLAIASNATDSEVLGIALTVDTTKTVVALAGKISGSVISNNLVSGGFSAGCVYFLDPSVAGGVTKIEPTLLGQVSKPMLLGLSGSEASILPYRGQYINGICGASGELTFNSTLYVTVISKGETASDFQLAPGSLIVGDLGSESPTNYEGLLENVYSKATNSSETQKILGFVSGYVGSYNSVTGGNIILKVYPSGSVVTDIKTYANWTTIGGGLIYLDSTGKPTNTQQSPNVTIGNVSNTSLVLNISSPSQTIYSNAGGGGAGSSNILINGAMDLWQRGRGVTMEYGITTGAGETKKQYFADRWILWAGASVDTGFGGSRQNFANTQTDVLGYPRHYASIRTRSTTTPDTSYLYSVVDDVRTIANKQLTFSFYAKTLGGTGSFSIHSIQNISLSPSGNTYINGTTHAVKVTTNSDWNRYSVTFIGPTAASGITNSYSLVGVGLLDKGKTFEFAQFILEEGVTYSTPRITDINEEYKKVAPYYQRSYYPNNLTGTKVDSAIAYPTQAGQSIAATVSDVDDSGMVTILYPPYNILDYTFPVQMKKAPLVTFYTITGKENQINIRIGSGYFDISSSYLSGQPGNIGTCTRFYNSTIPVYLNSATTNRKGFNMIPIQNICPFDSIMFHYVADADTTIN
jgi:hypothetical protein